MIPQFMQYDSFHDFSKYLYYKSNVAVRFSQRNTLLSEVASLSKLRHPNITVFYGVTNPPDAIIVCELLKSSLFQVIELSCHCTHFKDNISEIVFFVL